MSVFPSSLDSFPTIVDNVDDVVAAHPNNRASAIVKLETKVGIDGSATTSTLDYLIKSTSSINPGHKHPESKITFSAVGGHDHDGSNSTAISLPTIYEAFDETNNINATGAWSTMTNMTITQTFLAGDVLMNFTAPVYIHAGSSYFRIQIDNVTKVSTQFTISGLTSGWARIIPISLQKKETLTAGNHTIIVQWYANTTCAQNATNGARVLTVLAMKS